MTDVEEFLRDAAALAGLTTEDLLARVLHVEDGAFAEVVAAMDGTTKALALRLDREIRIRNPGLHYVMRSMFVGYRREGVTHSPLGERSQIFLSLIRNSSRLEVVLPVDPARIASMPNAQDLQGKGHHGVGNVRVVLSSDSEVDRFLRDLDEWLAPRP
ncbi:hypothetical protein [Mobilicoccus caccae]|uniref:DUF5655 domain-containing protein n=1 Tax=Mobilicoccus caccae TaxID=1859295 RepID=A0ABQ6IWV8_9MICO|nr:hypothetical protein [Mobilicoccus caccae]GMA42430.1 hypothetical protein GCM10025883_44750 [Mobilicoccus caccae]